jgi:AAHS family benzoate transporter-like MFS transporter
VAVTARVPRPRHAPAELLDATMASTVPTRGRVAFWVTSFMGLLLVYGLNTWLPQMMREAGYELGAALALLLVLNVGAVIGLLVAGTVADRIGSRRSRSELVRRGGPVPCDAQCQAPRDRVYVSVLLTGMFVFSAQVLVYAYVSRAYPPEGRATALGGAAGVGRIGAICGPLVGGWLLSAGIVYPWGCYVFATVAAIGAVSVSLAAYPPEDGRHDVPHGNYLPSYETTERRGWRDTQPIGATTVTADPPHRCRTTSDDRSYDKT